MLVSQPKSTLTRLVAGFGLGIVMATAGGVAYAGYVDPVIFSFATVGDSRQDPDYPDATQILPPATVGGKLLTQDKIWTQNSKAWGRILRSVQKQKPNMFFVNGDMIMGYRNAVVPASWSSGPTLSQVVNSDITQLYVQYAFWRGMVANVMETGTYMMPVPGNHETECKSSISQNGVACPNGEKKSTVDNENVWRANMSDLIGDLTANQRFSSIVGTAAANVRGLTAASAPQMTDTVGGTDQSYLSYSFDITTSGAILHFAVVNTDPTLNDSHAPTTWLTRDFRDAAARGVSANKPVKYFVFGHKMAFTYNYHATGSIAAGGLDVDTTARNNFWRLIAQYNAAYFCGHEHTTRVARYGDPTNTYTNKKAWQVLVGSGGSPFDAYRTCAGMIGGGAATSCPAEPATASQYDRWYAWALVKVHRSGKVDMDLYGFSNTFGPTVRIQSVANFQ